MALTSASDFPVFLQRLLQQLDHFLGQSFVLGLFVLFLFVINNVLITEGRFLPLLLQLWNLCRADWAVRYSGGQPKRQERKPKQQQVGLFEMSLPVFERPQRQRTWGGFQNGDSHNAT